MFLFIAVFRRGFYDEYLEVWKLSAYFPNTAGVIKFCPKICRLCIFASGFCNGYMHIRFVILL